jgi:hypothetical protein
MTSTCTLVPVAFVRSVSVAIVKVIGMVLMFDDGVAASGVMSVTGVVRALAVGCWVIPECSLWRRTLARITLCSRAQEARQCCAGISASSRRWRRLPAV